MPRLLVDKDWFDPLLPDSLVDTFYEGLLLSRADLLFPGFIAVRHRCFMSNDHGQSTPHLALIDRHYRSWWLVLLQAGKPPPAQFFVTQAEVVRSHDYSIDDARTLAYREPNLDEAKLIQLMKTELPKLYVILHHPPPPPLTNADIRIGVAELFRAPDGREILRINGEHPRLPQETVGVCRRDPIVKRMLHLTLRDGVAFNPANAEDIEIGGALSTWTIKKSGGKVMLVVPSSVVLPVDVDLLALVRSEDGRLQLVPHRG